MSRSDLQPVPPQPGFRFGSFELFPDSRELRHKGRRISLAPQPFRILTLLVSSPGKVITRDHLVREVWGDGVHVEFSQSLNSSMRKIRRALNDDAQSAVFIETIPRHGYRFIAPVSPISNGASRDLPEGVAPVPFTGDRDRRRLHLTLACLLGVVVISGILPSILRAPHPEERKTLVAVLPFQGPDDSTSESMQELSSGLTEEVTSRLAHLGIPGLGIISSATTERHLSGEVSMSDLGGDLGIDYIVTGEVRWEEQGAAVTVDLLRTEDSHRLWSETIHQRAEEIHVLKSLIASRLAGSIAPTLGTELAADSRRQSAIPPSSYKDYLRATYLLRKGDGDSLRRSIELFEKTIRNAPDYAPAHAGLAEALGNTILMGLESPGATSIRATEAAHRALEMDESLVEAHLALSCVQLHADWDPDSATRSIQRALELAPGLGKVHSSYAAVLSAGGQHDEAIREAKLAEELDPLGMAVRSDLCWYLVYGGRYREAVTVCSQALELEPGHQSTLMALAEAHARSGEGDLAFEKLGEALRFPEKTMGPLRADPDPLQALYRHVLSSMEAGSAGRKPNPFMMAVMNAQVGRSRQAIDWLEKAYDQRNSSLVYMLSEPRLADLRDEPDFIRLAARAGLSSN